MLIDFITDLTRKVSYEYTDEENNKVVKEFKVKGLSLKSLANIFAHEDHGGLLLKFVEGIDLTKENENDIKKRAVELIDTNYSSLVYHFIASCLYIKEEETGRLVSCTDEYKLLDDFPLALITKLLYHALELTLPEKEYEVKEEVKKLIALLTN